MSTQTLLALKKQNKKRRKVSLVNSPVVQIENSFEQEIKDQIEKAKTF